MNWSDIAGTVAKYAPTVGAALGGPAGAGIGALLSTVLGCGNSPSEVQQALITSPDVAVKLKELETQVSLAQVAAAAQQVQAVNATLQTDARGDSYWQKNHHAFESSAVVFMMIALYVGLPLAHIAVPAVPEAAFIMIGAILGVTAWQHGQLNTTLASQS